jgi:hypothetical protein
MNDLMRDDPDGPVSVALALLRRRWPISPALADHADVSAVIKLENDPRYLIGRLQQALSALLSSGGLVPMDSETSLLSQAIADAIAWRLHRSRPCPRCTDSLCAACSADWDQASRYHTLARALGAFGTPPRRQPAEQISHDRIRQVREGQDGDERFPATRREIPEQRLDQG